MQLRCQLKICIKKNPVYFEIFYFVNFSVGHKTDSSFFTFFVFFSSTDGLISTKHGIKYSLVKGINVCSNEGPHLFSRGDNNEIAKIHGRNFKIFFSRSTVPGSVKHDTKHPYLKWTECLFFFLNQRYGIVIALRKCVYWSELFPRWAMWHTGLLFDTYVY